MLALPERSLSSLDTVHCIDALRCAIALPDESVDCVVTSPPYYGLRDYGTDGQIGIEDTPQAFIARLVGLFAEIRRALKKTGVVWVNLGDSYATNNKGPGGASDKQLSNAGSRYEMSQRLKNDVPDKSLLMIPARFAIAMQDDGWILRSECVWVKPNPMPESVTDRPTKSHEMVYMFTRSPRYWYDADAVREPITLSSEKRYALANSRTGTFSNGDGFGSVTPIADENSPQYKAGQGRVKSRGNHVDHLVAPAHPNGRNARDVFTIATEPTPFAHFATFPQALIEPLILAGCPKGGVVFDPFMGSGTTALVARRLGRHYIGCDLNAEYVALANTRLQHTNKEEMKAALSGKPVTLPMFEQSPVSYSA